MRFARQNQYRAFAFFAVFLGIVVLGYQNCSQMPDQAEFPSEADLASQAPFPYDVDLDTYAYMSCSERPELDKNTYFTFKMGALRSGAGVYLSQAFRNFIQTNKLNTNKVEQILGDNTFSRDARLQVSIRAVSSLRGNPLGIGPYANRVESVWESLSRPPLSSNLTETDGVNKMYIGNGYLVGSVLISGSSETSIQDVLSTSGISVIGFQGAFFSNEAEKNYRVIAPYDVYNLNINGVFGRGYDPSFNRPTANGNFINHGNRIIEMLKERTVIDGSFADTGAWNCKSQAQYRIVPASDVLAAGCTGPYTGDGLSGDEAKAYNAAKTLLVDSVAVSPVRWKVDQTHRCIIDQLSSSVPSQCYDMNKGPIQWGLNTTDVCGGASGKQCPQYMSICWK